MGDLANRVNVDEAHFKLLPAPLDRSVAHDRETDPDIANIEKVYDFCHKWVFGHKPKDRLPANKGILLSLIREANVSIKLYLLTNMLAWEDTHHTLPFRARALTGPSAVHLVKTWAKAANERFGVFNTTSLDLMAESKIEDQDFEVRLRNSEVTAGSWITGYKMTSSGNLAHKLYTVKELDLDPHWLAIEPTYIEMILHPWVNGTISRNVDETTRRHRYNAVQIHGQLKREKRRAILMFLTREKIMPLAIRRVLEQRGYVPNDFKVENGSFTNPIKFWAQLGVAMQQIELQALMQNLPSFFTGTPFLPSAYV